MQSDSPQWKQRRLREIDMACVLTIAIAVPAAIMFFTRTCSEWDRYVDARHWTKYTAHVLSTDIRRDFGERYRKTLVVRMKVDGGREVEDAFHSVNPKVAKTMQEDLMKVGTIPVYRNSLNLDEYAISPVMTAHMRYMPSLLLCIAGTIGGFISLVLLWRYLRIQIGAAAELRHRFKMGSKHNSDETNATHVKTNDANGRSKETASDAPMIEQVRENMNGAKLDLSPEKVHE